MLRSDASTCAHAHATSCRMISMQMRGRGLHDGAPRRSPRQARTPGSPVGRRAPRRRRGRRPRLRGLRRAPAGPLRRAAGTPGRAAHRARAWRSAGLGAIYGVCFARRQQNTHARLSRALRWQPAMAEIIHVTRRSSNNCSPHVPKQSPPAPDVVRRLPNTIPTPLILLKRTKQKATHISERGAHQARSKRTNRRNKRDQAEARQRRGSQRRQQTAMLPTTGKMTPPGPHVAKRQPARSTHHMAAGPALRADPGARAPRATHKLATDPIPTRAAHAVRPAPARWWKKIAQTMQRAR